MREVILNFYKLYDSNCMAFWKRHNYEDNKKISGCPEFRGEEVSES